MFGLSWTQIWALVSRAGEISALGTDLAKVLKTHRPVIDHIIDTMADETTPPQRQEVKAKDKVNNVLTRSTSNVDNN